MSSSQVQRLGPYVLVDRIGDGGMAEIFLAKLQGYSGFEKLIALKKILPRYSQNPTFAKMLIHEAKLSAHLQHHNVVQVYDLGEIDGQVYIAMEYVRGRDLAAVLSNVYRQKERLPLDITLCIATEFVAGLDYAHRFRHSDGSLLGIVHRDVSPQNVLISYEGDVKVTDFGIARVVARRSGFELPGNLHGKFGYMSPEQILGDEIDQRSDIFSTGVVLYEMLTGQRLFRGKSHKETIEIIISREVPPPSTLNPDVPPDVDRVCARALARSRDARYPTMGALLGDLSRTADALPRRAMPRDVSVFMRRQFGASASAIDLSRHSRSRETESGGLRAPTSPRAPSGISPLAGTTPAMLFAGRRPLGQILVEAGAVSAADIEIALAEQRARGGRVGELLVLSGTIGEDELVRALSIQSGLPTISTKELLASDPPSMLLERFPREAAEARLVLPFRIGDDGENIDLAVIDPYDERAVLEAKILLGGSGITRHVASRSTLREAIRAWYRQGDDVVDSELPATRDLSSDEETLPERPIVLIADSDESVAVSLLERLEAEHCEVVTVRDGKRARDVLREKKPTVSIIEASLPGIDGYNVLLEYRAHGLTGAVFMTSTRSDAFRQSKAIELGADDFLVKPLDEEIVVSKIRREIAKRSGGRRIGSVVSRSHGVAGALEDMSAFDIVRSLELGKKSAQVVLQYDDGRSGEIGVKDGRVMGAIAGSEVADEAFHCLLAPGSGLFRIEYRSPSVPENLGTPNTALMVEALRRRELDIERRDPPEGTLLTAMSIEPGPRSFSSAELARLTDDLELGAVRGSAESLSQRLLHRDFVTPDPGELMRIRPSLEYSVVETSVPLGRVSLQRAAAGDAPVAAPQEPRAEGTPDPAFASSDLLPNEPSPADDAR